MRKIIGTAAVLLSAIPLSISAVTVEELQAQLSALLEQTKATQSQTQFHATLGAGDCPNLTRSLQMGSRGSDVSKLQEFLAQDPTVYPEGLVTGYFGTLTQNAVQRWQAIHGVAAGGTPSTTGYGVVGPKTRAAIAESCAIPVSAAPQVGASIKATPASGDAPLSVAIQVTVNTTNSCAAEYYTLDFGDGTTPQPVPSSAGICQPQSLVLTHVYRYGGQYQLSISARDHRTSTPIAVYGPTITGAIATTSASGQNSVKDVQIHMTDNAFSPSTFTVAPGAKVTWTNFGQNSHAVTSDEGAYDSGAIAPGNTYSLIFDSLGTYRYYDKSYGGKGGQGMSGLIIVTQTAQSASGLTFSYNEPKVSVSGDSVTMEFHTRGTCDGYSIDWGDDSTPVYRGGDGGQCGGQSEITLLHSYVSAGTYTIVLSRGPGLFHTDTPTVTIQ